MLKIGVGSIDVCRGIDLEVWQVVMDEQRIVYVPFVIVEACSEFECYPSGLTVRNAAMKSKPRFWHGCERSRAL